jgi:NAD(P)-dependent dehydrogenase (short-subunit alcohol dehydrogenase family)
VLRHEEPLRLSPAATVLITGGTSGLGLATAGWVAENGAGGLVLVSRSAGSSETGGAVDRMRAHGTAVRICRADVADPSRVKTLLAEIAADPSLPPLRGVIHAAGSLADRTLAELDWGDFEAVLAAKAYGARNIARALTGPMDFFVVYSSIAAVFGAAGQGNYAAANAFLDAFAATRWGREVGMSVAWGAWSETGMAARSSVLERTRSLGLATLTTAEGLESLTRAFAQPAVHLVATGVERLDTVRARLGERLFSGFEGAITPAAQPGPGRVGTAADSWTAAIAGLPRKARRRFLSERVCERARAVLGLPAGSEVETERPLTELGLDSLLSVELRNVLREAVGQRLPATLLYDYPTLTALTDHLLELIDPDAAGHGEAASDGGAGRSNLLDSVESLSDADIERRLAELTGHD